MRPPSLAVCQALDLLSGLSWASMEEHQQQEVEEEQEEQEEVEVEDEARLAGNV